MLWLVLLAGAVLLAAGGAGYVFFGGPADDPLWRKREEFQSRLARLAPQARAGDLASQLALAELHASSRPFGGDAAEAQRWFEAAARRGHAGAQFALGRLYESGDGVRRDYFKAAEWYALAVRAGDRADAEFALGTLYFHGRGVPHDAAEAVVRFDRAARRGSAPAQFLMGRISEDGWSGTPDPVKAFVWYRLAAAKREDALAADASFDPEAALDRLAAKMTPAQRKAAERALEAGPPPR